MCRLQIGIKCDGRFFEVSSDEKEKAEILVEEMVSQVLLYLFDGGYVDDVTIQFSANLSCTISIHAQCSCNDFSQSPKTVEHIQSAITDNLSSILRQLFIEIQIEQITIRPSKNDCISSTALSFRH